MKILERIYGAVPGGDVYLSRLRLVIENWHMYLNIPFDAGMPWQEQILSSFKFGAYFHMFHRGDDDRSFHDHPWGFWTYPLNSYYEDVLHPNGSIETRVLVERFKWHWRKASHTHIICPNQKFPVFTIVLPEIKGQEWGFYVHEDELEERKVSRFSYRNNKRRGKFRWIHHTSYLEIMSHPIIKTAWGKEDIECLNKIRKNY